MPKMFPNPNNTIRKERARIAEREFREVGARTLPPRTTRMYPDSNDCSRAKRDRFDAYDLWRLRG